MVDVATDLLCAIKLVLTAIYSGCWDVLTPSCEDRIRMGTKNIKKYEHEKALQQRMK